MSSSAASAARLLLAAILLVAALGKSRAFVAFVDYLHALLGRLAAPAAGAAITAEGALAIGLIAAGRVAIVGLLAAGFLLVATAVYAAGLTVSDTARCRCWGLKNADTAEGPTSRALRPMWYGLRNGTLAALALQATTSGGHWWATLAPMLGGLAIVAIGLAVSILIRRRHLRLRRHPLRDVFAPRLGSLIALSWYQDGDPRPVDPGV